MSTPARAVAEELRKRLPGVGEVKLQKLLYYAQGHHLATFGDPLFSDAIAAWDRGPVIASVWHDGRNVPDVPAFEFGDAVLTEAQLNTIGYVSSRYGGMSGNDLTRLSHGEPPWLLANENRQPGTSVRIDNETIRAYFLEVHEEEDESGSPVDADTLREWLSGVNERAARPSTTDTRESLDARRAELTT